MSETKIEIKSTVNLPQTEFPIRAGLLDKEPALLSHWGSINLYEKQKKQQEKATRTFLLHDGPPYPNGDIHMGHALNKILKDIIVRSKGMAGYKTPFVPGWDCHGLPIETQLLKILKKEGDTSKKADIPTFREACKNFSLAHVEAQKKAFQRLGVFAQWDKPYLTLNPQYEARVIESFGKLAENNLVYKGKKPIHWCPNCQTALAEAEIEHQNHRSPSIFMRFKVVEASPGLAKVLGDSDLPSNLIVWTTTPWTLPSNVALAVNPDLLYCVIEYAGERFVMADALQESVVAQLGWEGIQTIGTVLGKDMVGTGTQHPFKARESKVYPAPFVTDTDGAGFVHIAPGHGQDDYILAQQHGLDILMPVDGKGCFTHDVPQWEGQFIFKANALITHHMESQNTLLKLSFIKHSYPHCWRCHNPVIFRATEQWFVAIDQAFSKDKKSLRELSLSCLKDVKWHPDWGMKRMSSMLENRPDWCISRQRYWGIPIPVLYCASCRHAHVGGEFNQAIVKFVEKNGSSAWFTHSAKEIAPPHSVCMTCGHTEFEKSEDILDVWFESGASFASVMAPDTADLYLEGSDQHRGWFQSSLLLALGGDEKLPYKSVLTHGFIVDKNGKKMSKSGGNAMSPEKIINQYGADILRWWVASTDFKNDISVSDSIIRQARDSFMKVRNTIRFLLSNLFDYDAVNDKVSADNLSEIDQWVLGQSIELNESVQGYYESYHFHLAVQRIHDFCAVTLSAHYLDIVKDRLYCDTHDARNRRSSQTAMAAIVDSLLRLIAPILVFTAEDAYTYFKPSQKYESIHLCMFKEEKNRCEASKLKIWEQVLAIRSDVYQVLEAMRKEKKIRSFLETHVILTLTEPLDFQDWESLLIVSRVSIKIGNESKIEAEILVGDKCDRCWKYLPLNKSLCQRCHPIVEELNT